MAFITRTFTITLVSKLTILAAGLAPPLQAFLASFLSSFSANLLALRSNFLKAFLATFSAPSLPTSFAREFAILSNLTLGILMEGGLGNLIRPTLTLGILILMVGALTLILGLLILTLGILTLKPH